MTALIYLAAGNSRRFGSNKLLYETDGLPMYRHMLDKLRTICSQSDKYFLLVVTQYEEIMVYAKSRQIESVFSTDSVKGASYSVRAGLVTAVHLIKNLDSAVFFVADQPYMKAETVKSFLEVSENSEKGIACVSHDGETGNPVRFSAKYFAELEALEGDKGGKSVLKKHLEDVFYFEVEDKNELVDIDTK